MSAAASTLPPLTDFSAAEESDFAKLIDRLGPQ
jgi:hypothetical protein